MAKRGAGEGSSPERRAARAVILERRARFLSAALAGVGLVSGACSEDPIRTGGHGGMASGTTATGAGSVTTTSTSTAIPAPCFSPTGIPTTSSSCSEETPSWETVEVVEVAEDMPAAVGGDVVEGTYLLVEEQIFTGPDGSSGSVGEDWRSTLVLSAGQVTFLEGGDTYSGDYATAGPTELTFDITCPYLDFWSFGYTATADTLTLNVSANQALVFALQP